MKIIEFFKKNSLVIAYSALVVLILAPLMRKGYIFGTDLTFGPNRLLPTIGENTYLLDWVHYLWQQFLPVWLLEKIVFVFIFVIMIYGTDKLLQFFVSDKWLRFSGVLIVTGSPFLYERFVDGAFNVYWSYALYPLFLFLIIKFFAERSFINIIKLLIIVFVLLGTSIYNVLIIFLVSLIFFIVYLIRDVDKKDLFWKSGLVLLLAVITNLYWMIPTLQKENDQGYLIVDSVNQEDFRVFAPVGIDPLNVLLSVLATGGHWGAATDRYLSFDQFNSRWYLAWFLIFLLIIFGIVKSFKNAEKIKRIFLALLLIGIFCYFFALGVSTVFSNYLTKFLSTHFVVYNGFRETTKWLGLVPIVYAVFYVFGAKKLLEIKMMENKRKIILLAIILLPFLFSLPIFLGGHGQVKAVDYPKDWYELDEKINQTILIDNENCEYKQNKKIENCYTALVLPWHFYQHFKFVNRIVINPFVSFLKVRALVADNIEIGKIYSQSNRFESKIIEKYFSPTGVWYYKNDLEVDEYNIFLDELKKMGVKYIILDKEMDYEWYQNIFLKMLDVNLLKLWWSSDNLLVYEIY
ncbi:MAG: hypothetical protein WAV48_05190 [Candidatus Magasanikiibacteriota bacterium]